MARRKNASADASGQRPRAQDVAALADVSQMTVSRFLRAPDTVSPATRKRIAAAMRKTGYVPNRLAGGLASNKTNLICLIVADMRNPTLAATVQGVCDAVGDQGYQIMLTMGGRSADAEERAIREALSHRPCAMLIHNTTHSAMTRRLLRDAAIPIVEIGHLSTRPIDSVVSYSNFDAIQALTSHLLQFYRRIAFVGLAARYGDRATARRDGYLAAMRAANMDIDPAWVVEASDNRSGAKLLTDILAQAPDVEAVIFGGGDLAYEAALERRRQGWESGSRRIAIACYDNALVRSFPDIASLSIPRYEIGRKAIEIILARLRGELDSACRVELPFALIAGS